MTGPRLVVSKRVEGNRTAVVFLHGFLGDCGKTWGEFPQYLASDARLDGWDVLSLGYATSLFSYLPFWTSDPDLELLARQLSTVLEHAPLNHYDQIALVAHSMGGLIAQRALLDCAEAARRTGYLMMFGTPSGGLDNARRFSLLRRQIGDMAAGGPFITKLRKLWDERFGKRETRPFELTVVGGDRDAFVPADSSIGPFEADECEVAFGDHSEIVKPADRDDLSVQIVMNKLLGEAAPGGPWSAARVALEKGQFREVVASLEPHAATLDQAALVDLALALESLGRGEAALTYLKQGARESDARGALAGRLKRRWLQQRQEQDGRLALTIYREEFEQAVAAGDHEQAFYHGINVALLQLILERDRELACAAAKGVLQHCAKAAAGYWNLVTQAEAQLHLGELDAAVQAYADALRMDPEPRMVQTTYQQAVLLVDHLRIDARQLEDCFRNAWERSGHGGSGGRAGGPGPGEGRAAEQ